MTATRPLQVGDRVKTKTSHRWAPGRTGTIVELQHRAGNRIVVRFDRTEVGFYREIIQVQTIKDGVVEKIIEEPRLLRLSEIDLELLVESID